MNEYEEKTTLVTSEFVRKYKRNVIGLLVMKRILI